MATVAIPTNEVGKSKQWKERTQRIGSAALRLTQGVLAVALAALFGRFLGLKYGPLISPDKNEELLKFSLCSAAGLSTLKEFLNLFPKFWDYVKDGKRDNLYDFSAFVLLTSVTLAVASLGITKSKDLCRLLPKIAPTLSYCSYNPQGETQNFSFCLRRMLRVVMKMLQNSKKGWFGLTELISLLTSWPMGSILVPLLVGRSKSRSKVSRVLPTSGEAKGRSALTQTT